MSAQHDLGLPGALPERDRLALRRWMLLSIVAVFFAVAVGGITRLTESGLSITEWKPVSGALPPSGDAAWAAELTKFQQIPQASSTHAGITLTQFKWIYWWEWFHRNVARTVGLVFAIPWLMFMVQGRIPRQLRLRLTALPLLTLGQGALGWYMVQSGLVERISVSAYRLTAHLGLALGILAVSVWTYSELRERTMAERSEPVATSRGWQRFTFAFRVARDRPVVRRLILTLALYSLVSLPYIGLFPAVTELNFGVEGSSAMYKWLYATWAFGAALGGLALGTVFVGRDPRVMIRWGFAANAVAMVGFAASRSVVPAFITGFALGASYFFTTTAMSTVMQGRLQAHERGRTMALWFMSFGGTVPLGNMLFGPLVDRYGSRWLLFVGAAWALVMAWWCNTRAIDESAEGVHQAL